MKLSKLTDIQINNCSCHINDKLNEMKNNLYQDIENEIYSCLNENEKILLNHGKLTADILMQHGLFIKKPISNKPYLEVWRHDTCLKKIEWEIKLTNEG